MVSPSCSGMWTTELIDTLWNVNANVVITVEDKAIELIDTLWNVNTNLAPSCSLGGLN